MKSELVSQEKNMVELRVEFEAAEFEAELNKVFNNISQRANIPGFRKGHVPRKTIEMRFGKNAINDETVENLLNDNISEVIKDYDIEPLFAPQVKSRGPLDAGQPVSVNLIVEVRPEIKLPELEEIEIERLITAVDDTMVNDMVEDLRKSHAKVEAVDTPVGDDSMVSVEFYMVVLNSEGEEISRGKKPEMATINMLELPGEEFREPLMGKKAGDTADVIVQRPVSAENADEPLTSTRYEMKIVEIGNRVLPELNPDFFKICLGVDCPTEGEFRDAIAQRLLKRLQYNASIDAEARAIDTVADMSGFEVPGSLVYREMERLRSLDEKEAKERYKMEFKDFLKIMRGLEYEVYEKQILSRAWAMVRSSLVIDEIGRKYEIKIEPSDLDEWIKETAEKDGLDEGLLKQVYFRDKDSVNLLVDRVMSDKTVQLLMDKVKIKEVSELTPPPAKPEEPEEPAEAEKTEEAENPENTENA